MDRIETLDDCEQALKEASNDRLELVSVTRELREFGFFLKFLVGLEIFLITFWSSILTWMTLRNHSVRPRNVLEELKDFREEYQRDLSRLQPVHHPDVNK